MTHKDANIMVVESAEDALQGCQSILTAAGYHTLLPHADAGAVPGGHLPDIDVALVDLESPDQTTLTVLGVIRDQQPWVEVFALTGEPTIENAKTAVKLGASGLLTKPLNPATITQLISDAMERKEWRLRACPPEAPALPQTANPTCACWLTYEGAGLVTIGACAGFLDTIGNPVYVELPIEGETVRQGGTLFRVLSQDGRIQSVASPVTGRVLRVNDGLLDAVEALRGWVVRLDVAAVT